MAQVSGWRANDVVEYDAMRESATMLMALLLQPSHAGPASGHKVEADIKQLREDVLTVDGYDRAALAALTRRISSRVAELSGASS